MKKFRDDDEDENDSCVLIGTPLIDLLDEDAKFSVKPKRVDEQIVTDEKGRQRFHGAFTGGFSAGYFNSVGSKEGWAPSTFKSTRNERADKKFSNRPEDFMDEEDFSEHGIAPKTLQIKSNYKDDTPKNDGTTNKLPNAGTAFILDDLVKPVVSTIGVKMLRKMGWRDGQGVGPKIKRKLRSLKAKIAHEPGRKIYGVALPSESDQSDEDDQDDDYLVSTFDFNEFQFVIKEDLFGLGYKRLDVTNMFNYDKSSSVASESPAASLLFPMMSNKKNINKKGISGQSFGYGEFEDEEDVDIYKQDSIEAYDFGLDKKNQNDAKKLLNKTYGFGAFEDDVSILKKFFESKIKQQPTKVFPPPQIPPNFNLTHKFSNDESEYSNVSTSKINNDSMYSYLKTATDRGHLLGEVGLQTESVFDLIRPADREFLKEQKQKIFQNLNVSNENEVLPVSEANMSLNSKETDKESKARRYESFVSFILKNFKDPYSFVDTKNLTEWEKETEKDEFFKTYEKNMKKIEKIKNEGLKFVSTSFLNEQNQEHKIDKKEEVVLSNLELIAKPNEEKTMNKKYGKETRVEYEWRPHPTLCKRFNVPNPFADSSSKEYGTVRNDKHKAPKFSLFNVLSASTRFDKEKTKSLFDELNADVPVKQGPSFAKTVIIQDKNSQPSSSIAEKPKIEFETKKAQNEIPNSEFSSFLSEGELVKKDSSQILKTDEVSDKIKNNVYMQERPNFDMFKAIFENDDDDEEEEQNQSKVSSNKSDSENDQINSKEMTNDNKKNKQIESTVPSSIDQVKFKNLSKYLKPEKDNNDYYDYDDKKDSKEEVYKQNVEDFLPEKIKFTQLVKSLASAKSKTEKDTSTDNESSSTNSSDSDIQIVYEEISISSNKKSHKEKSKKKKKKNKNKKKKKSKKSSNKND